MPATGSAGSGLEKIRNDYQVRNQKLNEWSWAGWIDYLDGSSLLTGEHSSLKLWIVKVLEK
jgi:hypothetical protein